VFTADGAGHLANGVEDLNDSLAGVSTGITFSGTYSIGPDGRGTAIANSANGSTTFKFVMVSTVEAQAAELPFAPLSRSSERRYSATGHKLKFRSA